MTAAVRTRNIELTTTVTFHAIEPHELAAFARKLASAMGTVVADYPAVVAFLMEPDTSTGDLNYGLRFKAVDPQFVEDMADEILEKSVELLAQREGGDPVEAEVEESVLVLTR